MKEQSVDEWFKKELAGLICRYESKQRSEAIKRGIQRRKEKEEAGSKIR
jgi:hypothetical protein